MQLKVKTLTGKEIAVDVEEDALITRVKEKVEEQSGVPPQQQRLIHSGRQLKDDDTVEGLKLKPNEVLHLVLALRGGSC